ncbi:allantoinase PuuE [Comamonas badia]|uniref:allantoinase PuuE n=1 Tax=Comamonas badia TaxID=265291 RepID=UPI000420EC2D|nr:allantoinase PuuE [Comamonas badia]
MTTPAFYDATAPYPRDLIGYGRHTPQPCWPGQARIAVSFVLNYEEGGENCVLHGDAGSEQFLSELFNPAAYPARHMSMESIYEYGSRAGVWRILREFERRKLPLTVYGIATALQKNREVAQAFDELGHEVACHGLRWIHYQDMPEAQERAHMQQCLEIFEQLYGSQGDHAQGWYTGRDSPHTHRLVADTGRFTYDADYYGDDLPFWMKVARTDGSTARQLIVPYTLDVNDMRFGLPQGYSHADPFFAYMRDAFDVLYAEGDPRGQNAPKMMTIGLHCRMVGHPGRFIALQKFLDHIAQHEQVWVCRRIDLARHWQKQFPAPV